MKVAVTALATLALVAYPFLVSYALHQGWGSGFALALLGLLALRAWLQPAQSRWLTGLAMALVGLYAITREPTFLHWYPVLVNGVMLVTFGYSLRQGPSMIERFARMRHPDLPEAARPYLARVTAVWCGFFLVNGAIACWTVLHGDARIWTWYNGFIAYLLMGSLLLAEYLVRPNHEVGR